jgi:hypothetical protein
MALMQDWGRDRKPNVHGAIGGYLLRPDNRPCEAVLVRSSPIARLPDQRRGPRAGSLVPTDARASGGGPKLGNGEITETS